MADHNADSEELEALFDSIVTANDSAEAIIDGVTKPKASSVATPQDDPDAPSEIRVFNKLGHMTRQLHDTLRELGIDKSIEEAVSAMPDTRDRLNYIATLTEQAAVRSLSATEVAKPIQDKLEADAEALSKRWQKLFDNQLTVEDFKQLVKDTRAYLGDVPKQTQATNAQLLEVMMAQDFQDLTGQVIKKIVEVAHQLEQQLLQLLLETTPPEKKNEVCNSLLNGPVINKDGRTDIVADQSQVDDLLESLGF